MSKYVQQAVDAIIRPPRRTYKEKNITTFVTGDDGKVYYRHPITVFNDRNQRIVGSIYHAPDMDILQGGKCIIYLHGNASSQLEGQFLVPNFCPYGIFVYLFDFAGCGNSGGDYISLGYFEMTDTIYLINFLIENFNMTQFALWGRSMGAATALLVDHPFVVAKCSDSAFTSIPDLCTAIAKSLSLPSMFVPFVLWYLKKQIISIANFDFESVSPVSYQLQNFPPCIFGHAVDDEFIPFEQTETLYNKYPNKNKHMMAFQGGHNGKRDLGWLTLVITIIFDSFGMDISDIKVSECRNLQSVIFHFSSFSSMTGDPSQTNPSHADISHALNDFEQNFQKNQQSKTKISPKNSPQSLASGRNPLNISNPKNKSPQAQQKKDEMDQSFDENDDADDESFGEFDENFKNPEDTKGDSSSNGKKSVVNSQNLSDSGEINKKDEKILTNKHEET